eukprot:g9406.t2
MTAAGQAMVVLVPIREKSAMTYINDTDAKLMGIVDEEKERLAQVDENMKKEQQRKASDLAELREARKELRKSKDKAMPKEAVRNLWQQAFLEVSPPASCRSSFKRLTAEERAELEEMKTSRFDKESKGVGGSSVEGDNGQAVPLGFLTSVPGVSTLAGNSYVLNAVEYAKKENPMTALWTAGPVVFSAVVGAARSTYNYFFPPQDASTLQLTRDGLAAGMGDCWPVAQVLLCLAVQPLLLDGLDNPHQQPAAGLALAASRQHLAAGLVEGVVSQLLLAGSVAQPLRAARRPVQRPVAFLGDYLEAGQAG